MTGNGHSTRRRQMHRQCRHVPEKLPGFCTTSQVFHAPRWKRFFPGPTIRPDAPLRFLIRSGKEGAPPNGSISREARGMRRTFPVPGMIHEFARPRVSDEYLRGARFRGRRLGDEIGEHKLAASWKAMDCSSLCRKGKLGSVSIKLSCALYSNSR